MPRVLRKQHPQSLGYSTANHDHSVTEKVQGQRDRSSKGYHGWGQSEEGAGGGSKMDTGVSAHSLVPCPPFSTLASRPTNAQVMAQPPRGVRGTVSGQLCVWVVLVPLNRSVALDTQHLVSSKLRRSVEILEAAMTWGWVSRPYLPTTRGPAPEVMSRYLYGR